MSEPKKTIIPELMAQTGRSEVECLAINSILESHFLFGQKAKGKIIADFQEKLSLDESAANDLYNTCMGIIASGIFKR